jgi:hypothetical protein
VRTYTTEFELIFRTRELGEIMRAKNRPSAFSDAEFRGTVTQERYILLHVVAGTVSEARYTDVVAVVPPAPTVVVVSRTVDRFGVKVRLLVEAQFRQREN